MAVPAGSSPRVPATRVLGVIPHHHGLGPGALTLAGVGTLGPEKTAPGASAGAQCMLSA